jgi:hypothetical protein
MDSKAPAFPRRLKVRLKESTMTLLALLLALAQQGGQPTTHDQPAGVNEPSPKDANPKASTSSNTTDKSESLSPVHNTELQGGQSPSATKKTKTKNKKPQARSAKPLGESSVAPSAEKADGKTERDAGQGKARKQPKPLGEKSDQ